FYSPSYPKTLSILKDAPPILYIRGKLRMRKLVAIVGSRNASPVAEQVVKKIVTICGLKKYGIVSGLAMGIDSFAHQSAIDQGCYTMAVLPTALDHIYPVENYRLANKILENKGALISEIPLGINRGRLSFI